MDKVKFTLSVEEAAELIGVTVSALRRWIREGRAPPYFRAGRLIRFRRTDLEAWIEARIVASEERRESEK
jgi:excisionase family DNA binding protein